MEQGIRRTVVPQQEMKQLTDVKRICLRYLPGFGLVCACVECVGKQDLHAKISYHLRKRRPRQHRRGHKSVSCESMSRLHDAPPLHRYLRLVLFGGLACDSPRCSLRPETPTDYPDTTASVFTVAASVSASASCDGAFIRPPVLGASRGAEDVLGPSSSSVLTTARTAGMTDVARRARF